MKKPDIETRKRKTISSRQYYYFALWLPVFFPPFLLFKPWHEMQLNLFNLVVFGIIQYVIFALWSMFKYRGATIGELKRFPVTAPLLFVPFYAAGFILIYIYNYLPRFDVLMMVLVLSLISIPVGYVYVFLFHVVEIMLKKSGVIQDDFP